MTFDGKGLPTSDLESQIDLTAHCSVHSVGSALEQQTLINLFVCFYGLFC